MSGEGKIVGGIIGIVIAIIVFFTTILMYYSYINAVIQSGGHFTAEDISYLLPRFLPIPIACILGIVLFGVIIWAGLREMSAKRQRID
ncbi:MAG: hypothetical protein PHH26_02830 [Candidatus Thermoplasmatota archaeon]|nr:hypothetical protein [Candidatus Thermoplasmatota archaeon]